LRFLFAIGRALNLVVTGSEARYRACAQLQSEEPGRHSFAYGGNDFLMAIISHSMANNHLAMAEITSRYGGNYAPLWRILFRYGENSPENGLEWQELSLLGDGRFLGYPTRNRQISLGQLPRE
jgi:hypothetical protein